MKIRSHQGDYSVHFNDSLSEGIAPLLSLTGAVISIDRKVKALYQRELSPLLERFPHFELDATEEEKSLVGVQKLGTWMQKQDCTRSTTLICIGGGIIQDISAFMAHIYYRGIRWIYVPTTLLSMSDSCIGAKCGINFNDFKNQLGMFHSPSQVVVCSEFVKTLTDGDVASGYGEILKLALTGSRSFYDRLKAALARSGLRNPELTGFIRSSLEVKKPVIEEDEYEADLRRILNYGHTFGHALESITHHEIPHGLAVAWGMDLVNFLSVKKGWLAPSVSDEIHQMIRTHLPFRIKTQLKAEDFISRAKRDKKAASGQISLVLLRDFGKLEIVKTPLDSTLEASLGEYLATSSVY
jgi:3-dehydroquinate synthase